MYLCSTHIIGSMCPASYRLFTMPHAHVEIYMPEHLHGPHESGIARCVPLQSYRLFKSVTYTKEISFERQTNVTMYSTSFG